MAVTTGAVSSPPHSTSLQPDPSSPFGKIPMRALSQVSLLVAVAAALSACQSEAPTRTSHATAALPVMERITLGASACWFKSKDPAFAAYKLSPELDSYSGKPRVLMVDRHHPESRPDLVIMAEGDPARLQAFGPMMQGPLNARITAGVNHWARGNTGCPG